MNRSTIAHAVLTEPNVKHSLLKHSELTKNEIDAVMFDKDFDFEHTTKRVMDQVVYFYYFMRKRKRDGLDG